MARLSQMLMAGLGQPGKSFLQGLVFSPERVRVDGYSISLQQGHVILANWYGLRNPRPNQLAGVDGEMAVSPDARRLSGLVGTGQKSDSSYQP